MCIEAQTAKPKDQYLLLRSLNEVIVSLASSKAGTRQLPLNYQAEVRRIPEQLSFQASERTRAALVRPSFEGSMFSRTPSRARL